MHNLLENIVILDTINLVELDHNPNLIYQRLLKYKKSVYQHNEKIIVIHKDTEYFYFNHPTGFSLYNLFSCWRDLDIPYSTMILCSNYHDLNRAVDPFIVNQQDRPLIIDSLLNHQSYDFLKHEFPGTQYKDIQYPAACLLGRKRSHRIKILQFLNQNNLLDLVKTNFNSNKYSREIYDSVTAKISFDATFSPLELGLSSGLYSQPHRHNHSEFSQSKYPEIVALNQWPAEDRDDPELDKNFYQYAFMEIVTESMFDCPHCFLSDKIFKPMIHRTPFLFFGTPNSLKRLRNHGFKTFNDFWSEDYDIDTDNHLRFLKCCRTMQEIVTLPLTDLIAMYQHMQDILNHNYNRLVEYIDYEYKPMHEKLGL